MASYSVVTRSTAGCPLPGTASAGSISASCEKNPKDSDISSFILDEATSLQPLPSMPVTFSPSPDTAIEPRNPAFLQSSPASMVESALSRTSSDKIVKAHLQSSFGHRSDQDTSVSPQRNGFVDTVYTAYSQHHALVIRPDDVWICIMTQFNLFVNGQGRAEQLRYLFVAHEDKKYLVVNLPNSDWGHFAQVMTEKLHENVVDPGLREWCLPDFSTTTENDKVVASVVMMATLKAYFNYGRSITCGIPRVTLLGTQQDWLRICHRVDKLEQYGVEAAAWRDLLKPVLVRFARAFEPGYADSAENRDFWQRVVHVNNNMSGPTLLGGWITAFCGFNDEGRWMGAKQDLEVAAVSFFSLSEGPDD
jgi:hypothetical protein